MRTVVFDTNVLLADPESIFGFPGAEIVLPETVLAELDKVKTGRADADLKFRGREVSRVLFDLSEEGDLAAGVELPGGGQLRVVPLRPDLTLPEGLSGRNADDRILAVAFQVCEDGCDDLTLVTNDLNMLLKAQTLGIKVERRDNGPETSFGRRFIVRPFQRYRIPLGILAMSLAVFAAIVVLTLLSRDGGSQPQGGVPSEFRQVLSAQQEEILDLLLRLQDNPTDTDAMLGLANEYYNLSNHTSSTQIAEFAKRYYEQYLQMEPQDLNARTDLAIMHFTLGDSDRAIQEVSQVLQSNPDHVNANYNAGIFYWKGQRNYARAAAFFRTVLDLTANAQDANGQQVNLAATNALTSLAAEALEAGQPIEDLEGT